MRLLLQTVCIDSTVRVVKTGACGLLKARDVNKWYTDRDGRYKLFACVHVALTRVAATKEYPFCALRQLVFGVYVLLERY